MKRRKENEFSMLHIILGLLMGFMIGASMIYWHTTRQTDRIIEETYVKVMEMFTAQSALNETHQPNMPLVSQTLQTTPDSVNSIRIKQPASLIQGLNQEYPIAQDKLIYTRIIALTASNEKDNYRKLDSLMGQTSQPPPQQHLFIEFWESPLNTIGYKMGKNKIILYGIKSVDMASIAMFRGKTYLRYLNEYYPLELSTSLRPLIPAHDSFFSHDEELF